MSYFREQVAIMKSGIVVSVYIHKLCCKEWALVIFFQTFCCVGNLFYE